MVREEEVLRRPNVCVLCDFFFNMEGIIRIGLNLREFLKSQLCIYYARKDILLITNNFRVRFISVII